MRLSAERRHQIGIDLLVYWTWLDLKLQTTLYVTRVEAYGTDLSNVIDLDNLRGGLSYFKCAKMIKHLDPTAEKKKTRAGKICSTSPWMVDPNIFKKSICDQYEVTDADLPGAGHIACAHKKLDVLEQARLKAKTDYINIKLAIQEAKELAILRAKQKAEKQAKQLAEKPRDKERCKTCRICRSIYSSEKSKSTR